MFDEKLEWINVYFDVVLRPVNFIIRPIENRYGKETALLLAFVWALAIFPIAVLSAIAFGVLSLF